MTQICAKWLIAGFDNPHYPNVNAVAKKLSSRGHITCQQWQQYASKCVQPGLDYFVSKFVGDAAQLGDTLAAFKAARLFVPHRLVEMDAGIAAVDSLAAFPFLNKPAVLDVMKSELANYLALAQDVSPEMDKLEWWKGHSRELPHWSTGVQNVVLVQPSSAASERVFSFLKASFGPQQDCTLQDYNYRNITDVPI